MANIVITANTYLDGGVARVAGDTYEIQNGARFTIRTDSRIHANAPASFTGSLASPTFTGLGGELYIDSSAVREISYTGGSGNLPAIGTAISQGGVSGYLLGCWSAIGAAPTAVGAAIPAAGILKLREVTGGAFAAGALTGISATCSGADRPSWIEIVWDAATNFVVGRVGKFTTRDGGNLYEIGQTNGSVAQTLATPTTSSTAANNFCPGAWVETSPGSDEYEFWPGLASAANGWIKTAIGFAEGYTDKRGQFVKTFAGGNIQFGETVTQSGTYVTVAGQASTYADIAISSSVTYVRASNVITVNTNTTAHLLNVGQQIGLDFTSGGATDGAFTVTEVVDAFNFKVASVGADTSGNVTVRPGVTVTFTAHGLNEGEQVYCDFTSGTGVDGVYTIYAVTGANTYNVAYPHTAAITGGNVTANSKIQITATAHGMAIGNEVYCDFTSGGATDGKYIMRAVAANTIDINYPFSAAIASSNVTLRWTVGHVPVSGCKVKISNILLSECATASRATNSVPNATIASRPEFTTTTAGAIDLEGLYVLSGRSVFAQPYSVRLRRCALSETLDISECATALDIDDVGIGQYSAQDARALQLTSNFAGGTVSNVVAGRATIGTTDHAMEVINCNGQTFNNVRGGIILYARSTGIALNISTCQSLTLNGTVVYNGNIQIATSVNIALNDTDYVDRLIGQTTSTTPYYAISAGSGCNGITIDGFTTGLGGAIDGCHPYTGLFNVAGASNVKIRNVGSPSGYCKTGSSWSPNLYGCGVAFVSSGNNNSVKMQKWFVGRLRTGLFSTVNSDKNMLVEQVLSENPWIHSAKAARTEICAWLNANVKGQTTGSFFATAQTSVYGTHWIEQFQGKESALILVMNEPTTETLPYWSNPAGVALFNSAGGIEMRAIGDEAIWEMPYFAQGRTGFKNTAAVMSGGTIGNYTLQYQIDTGSGWNGSWKTLNGTNLSAETISPTTGFKLKIRITTGTTNSTAITFLRITTLTTKAAQEAIDYPLDTNTLTLTGLVAGSDIVVLAAGTETERANVDANPVSSYGYVFSTAENIDIGVFKAGYVPLYVRNYALSSNDASLPISQVADRNYSA
jgi:hypothetical protein